VCLVSAFLVLPGQGERLTGVLQGLIAASHTTTDLAEPCDPAGMIAQRTRAETVADCLLQQCAPLREAPLEHIGIAQTTRNES
jgi:hypothetical protein